MSYSREQYQRIKLGLEEKTTGPKPKKPLRRVSPKKLAEQAEAKKGGDTKLDEWFEARRKEMKGRCALCNGKTERDNDETYRRSIHHILEKRPTMFPSVALHPDNFLEVCFWGNSCHTNLHNGTITWELLMDSAEKDLILGKIEKIYPFIAENEKKYLPDILITELNKKLIQP